MLKFCSLKNIHLPEACIKNHIDPYKAYNIGLLTFSIRYCSDATSHSPPAGTYMLSTREFTRTRVSLTSEFARTRMCFAHEYGRV